MAKTSAQLVLENQARRRDLVRRYRASIGCQWCGERDARCLELHHTDPKTKHPALKTRFDRTKGTTWRPGWHNMSYDEIVSEVGLCVVVCVNCHRKHDRRFELAPPLKRRSPKLAAAERALGLS